MSEPRTGPRWQPSGAEPQQQPIPARAGDPHRPPPPPRPAREFGARPTVAKPARPRASTGSFWLWIAVAVALMIAAIIPFVADTVRADLVETVAREFPQDSEATRGRVVVAVLATLSGAGLLLAVLVTAFAFAMRVGHRAARFLLAALAVLTGLYATIASQALPPAGTAVLLVAAALAVAAAVAMFLPASNAWFARR